LVAVGVGLAAAGLVGYVAFFRPRPEDAPRTPRTLQADLDSLAKGAAGDDTQARGVRIELADKKDPTRVATVLLARSVTPREGRAADVTEPGALVFLKDGRTLRIRADAGNFSSFSADQTPERGVFTGNVTAQVYAPGVSPRTTDWDTIGPLATADFGDRFEFDLTFGRILIPGAFAVRGEGIEIKGSDATLVLDEAAAALRSGTIARGFRISSLEASTTRPSAAPSPASSPKSSPSTETTPAAETRYRVTMPQSVAMTIGPADSRRTLDAAKAEAFVRLVGNSLRPGAIARLEDTTAAKNPTNDNATNTPPNTASTDEPFSITTQGPVEIRLAADTPTELQGNDLALRLEGNAEPVRFADATAKGPKASGEAAALTYAASKGDLTLLGSDARPATLRSENEGVYTAAWTTLNLPTKVGQARGEGRVEDFPASATDNEPARTTRRVSWGEQADFRLARAAKSNAWEIAWAQLTTNVSGTDGTGTFHADTATVDFSPRSQPTRATLDGGASAHDGKRGVLSGDSLDLAFRTLQTGKTEPNVLTAKGAVEARDDTRLLAAGLLEARLDRDDRQRLAVSTVVAKDTVNFADSSKPGEPVAAQADELRANVPAKKVDLIGKEASITQGTSQIVGSVLNLDGERRAIAVPGGGRFSTAREDGSAGLLAAEASWSRSMSYDDQTGILEALGDAKASGMPDEFTIDRLAADKVVVSTRLITPRPDPAEGAKEPDKQREVDALRAEMESPAARATVESRRYDGPVSLASTAGRRVERLWHLEGSTILADQNTGTLTVPAAGKALALDRRAAPEGTLETADGRDALSNASGFRGTALFDWSGSMTFTRASGVLDLVSAAENTAGVKITADRPADGSLVFLQSDRATATILGLADISSAEMKGQLSDATATGNVFGRFKTAKSERELSAHTLAYDAAAAFLRVLAVEGGELSLLDTASGTPVKAAELTWDLAADRVEIVKPSPITTPR
jgi:lipopolysaccharide export system protein LptA